LVMIEIAEMLTQKRLLAAAQSERSLELTAYREHGTRAPQRQLNRPGRIAAGAPQRQLDPIQDARYGVVAADMNGPVVDEKEVRDAGQLLERIVVLIRDWLIRTVATGHHKRHPNNSAEQQMVQRRVR